jgi:hypothetical protein
MNPAVCPYGRRPWPTHYESVFGWLFDLGTSRKTASALGFRTYRQWTPVCVSFSVNRRAGRPVACHGVGLMREAMVSGGQP